MELHIVTVVKGNDVESAWKYNKIAETKVMESNFQPICHVLKDDTEKVIAEYIEGNQINFLIMGAYGHNRIRHLVIGSTRAQMLRRCHIPILLFRNS